MNSEEQRKLNTVYEWMMLRRKQQLAYPFDTASKRILGLADGDPWTGSDAGSITTTHSISIPSTPTSITVPKNPDGTRVVNIGGAQYNIPFYV